MRIIKRKLLAAWWAFRNPDKLTMLYHELAVDSMDRNSRGYPPNAAFRARWYRERYLDDLPIR